jgi:hypothetical protein
MLRRDFLGQVLGLVVGAPFYARLFQDPFPVSKSSFKLGVILGGDDKIYHAPAVVSVTYKIISNVGHLQFVAEELHSKTAFTVVKIALLENHLMLCEPILTSQPIFMNSGDELKLTYNLSITASQTPPRALIEALAAVRGSHK